jgi:hypothetical protein
MTPKNFATQDHGSNEPIVVDTVEARQARRVGLIWILVISLVLAAIAGLVLTVYY